MSGENIIFHEQCSVNGDICYYQAQGSKALLKYKNRTTLVDYCNNLLSFLKQIVLPHGYPDSVSGDYLEYQIWDTIQAFCSTITSAFTTRAILKGVGVGNAQASALSATVAWILKDGTGMMGRILFAWWKGCDLDNDCKKWRFVADIINDGAMAIELVLPFFENYSLKILCLTSLMKSIVGVAGGATRASITHHQAINDNMAEISAIDGTQETIVNLVASIISIILLNSIHVYSLEVLLVIILMTIHLAANYNAVKALIFKKFNRQRFDILLKSYLNVGLVLHSKAINQKEAVVLGFGTKDVDVCGFKLKIGKSLAQVANTYSSDDFIQLLSIYEDKKYIIIPDVKGGSIHIAFDAEGSNDILEAYFYATLLGVALCVYFDRDVETNPKRFLYQSTPLSRLSTFMKDHQRREHSHKIPIAFYSSFKKFVTAEMKMFFTVLELQDWNLTSHDINFGDWRVQWKSYVKKNM